MTPHVALFGEFGLGNLGNDMSCRAAKERLAEEVPEAEFAVLVRDTGRTEEALGLPAVTFARAHGRSLLARLWAKLMDLVVLLRVVTEFDLVVVPGTGLLEEATALFPGGHLVWLASLSFACRARGVPLAWLGLGGSPYRHRLPAWVAAWAARGARRRSYRDTMTRDAMDQAGLDVTGDRLVHDLVLATDPRPVVPSATGRRVVVSVVNQPVDRGRARYATVLAEAVDRLAAAGDEVTMVIMDDSDVDMTDEVLALLDGPEPPTARPAGLDSLLAVLADADVVVASRYHALVATLLAGRGVVAVAHAAKDAALLDRAGLDAYVLDIATVSADDVLEAVAAARADAARFGPACDRVCEAARRSVGAEVAAVASLLDRALERR